MISLSIDGKKANVNEGATVIEAVRSRDVVTFSFAGQGVTRMVATLFESPIVGGKKQVHVLTKRNESTVELALRKFAPSLLCGKKALRRACAAFKKSELQPERVRENE